MKSPTDEEAVEVLREVFAEAECKCAALDGPTDCITCGVRKVVLERVVGLLAPADVTTAARVA